MLVAEDEAPVRRMLTQALASHGYRVLDAVDGESALSLARAHAGEIHLLLSDVVMPGVVGPQLAKQLREERPALRCLFISGYAADREGRGYAVEDEDLLMRPFTPAQLAARVREVLDRRT